MDKNGKKSCTGNSRHIDIRYLFVKDQFDSINMSIAYSITEHMLAYLFIKSLEGALFVKFRKLIIGRNTHRYPTYGTALNQGLCWKYGQGQILKKWLIPTYIQRIKIGK